MTTTAAAAALHHPELYTLLAAIRDRLEVVAPDVPADLRGLLGGSVGLLKHAALVDMGPILLALTGEVRYVVEALVLRSLREPVESLDARLDLARRIERIGTACQWAYLALASGRGGAGAVASIACVALAELVSGEPVEGIAERMMREWGEEQRAEAAALAAPDEAA